MFFWHIFLICIIKRQINYFVKLFDKLIILCYLNITEGNDLWKTKKKITLKDYKTV